MAYPKGRPRPEGAGRKKGTPNKSSIPLEQKAQELGVDPFAILLMFAKEDWQGLGYSARSEVKFSPQGIEFEEFVIAPAMRMKAAAEACQYLHAKRKAIENTIDPRLLEALQALDGKSDEELLAIVNQSALNSTKRN